MYKGLCIGGPHDGCEQECDSDIFAVMQIAELPQRYVAGSTPTDEPLHMKRGHYVYEWIAVKQNEHAELIEFGLWRWYGLTVVEMWQRIFERYAK